jgi:methyl-accepting chemotaxis protein
MNIFRSQTGRRVCASFGVLLLISAVTTAVSLVALDRMRGDTAQLVGQQLAREQAAAELQGELRLNGAQATALANSDSQEFSDLILPQLAASDRRLAEGEARLAEAGGTIAGMRGAYQQERAKVLQYKDQGQTQLAVTYAEQHMQPAFRRYADLVGATLADQSRAARELAAQAEERYRQSRAALAALGVAAVAVALVLAWRLTVRVVLPLRAAVDYAQAVSNGDLSRSLDISERGEIADLLRALSGMVDDLAHTVARVRSGAMQVDGKARQLAEGSAAMAQRTESQAGAIQQTAASVEQLSTSATENSVRAEDARALAQEASGIAGQANASITGMLATMERIHAASRRVADIVGVLDEIAFQTNLLALNAGVEAARAGEHGRGFAVVATEVRMLAGRASTAAAEIKQLTHQSSAEAGAGQEAAAGAAQVMANVDATVRRVTALMQEISRASAQQQLGIGEIHSAVAEIDRVVQQNAAQVSHTAQAANDMQHQARNLAELVEDFRLAQVGQ